MILVTGASGFVGSRLVADLAAAGLPTRGTVRAPGTVLPRGAEAATVSDLGDVAALRRACAGVDTIVHLAARVHQPYTQTRSELEAYRTVNVEGTRVVVQAAAAAGVRRFVFVSSVKAAGDRCGPQPLRETDEPAPRDPYGRSKLEAERVVMSDTAAAGMDCVVLRPPLVYGAGMRANMLRLFEAIRRGMPLPLGGIRNRRSFLFVGNFTAAIRAVVQHDGAGRGTYYVADTDSLSTPELVQRIAAALGRPCRLVPVPPALLRGMGHAVDCAAMAFGRPGSRLGVIDRLTQSLHVDTSALRDRLGFEPPYSTDNGLQETAAWFLRTHPG